MPSIVSLDRRTEAKELLLQYSRLGACQGQSIKKCLWLGAGTAFIWTGKSSYLITAVSHPVFLGHLNYQGKSPQVIISALGRMTDGGAQWYETKTNQRLWVSVDHTHEQNERRDTLRSSHTRHKEVAASHAQPVTEELLTFYLD